MGSCTYTWGVGPGAGAPALLCANFFSVLTPCHALRSATLPKASLEPREAITPLIGPANRDGAPPRASLRHHLPPRCPGRRLIGPGLRQGSLADRWGLFAERAVVARPLPLGSHINAALLSCRARAACDAEPGARRWRSCQCTASPLTTRRLARPAVVRLRIEYKCVPARGAKEALIAAVAALQG